MPDKRRLVTSKFPFIAKLNNWSLGNIPIVSTYKRSVVVLGMESK